MIIEEFEASNVFLRHPDRRVFYSSAWSTTSLVPFLAYRLVIAMFTLFILLYSFTDYILSGYGVAWFFIYATNWTFLIQATYFNMAAVLTALACANIGTHPESTNSNLSQIRRRKGSRRRTSQWLLPDENGHLADDESDSEVEGDTMVKFREPAPSDDLLWYHKTLWVMYNIMAPTALLITFLRALAMGLDMSFQWAKYLNPLTDILHHFCNGGIVIVDIFISATPTRILHAVHPFIYSCVYNLFLIIYWVSGGFGITGHRWVYPVVNFSDEYWRSSIIFIFAGLFVVLPVFHLMVFGLYKLKCAIVRCVIGTTKETSERTRLLSESK